MLTSGITAERSTGATVSLPSHLSRLARAHAELGQFDNAWCCIGEALAAVETTGERWDEAEVNRIAGEIALMSPKPDETKAQRFFERALAVARQQHAKSWELRAAMSMARLWRDQGKPQQARELLAPVYAWFTEGFDTLDLKEAKALLEELASSVGTAWSQDSALAQGLRNRMTNWLRRNRVFLTTHLGRRFGSGAVLFGSGPAGFNGVQQRASNQVDNRCTKVALRHLIQSCRFVSIIGHCCVSTTLMRGRRCEELR